MENRPCSTCLTEGTQNQTVYCISLIIMQFIVISLLNDSKNIRTELSSHDLNDRQQLNTRIR